jgi:hypothetical protein
MSAGVIIMSENNWFHAMHSPQAFNTDQLPAENIPIAINPPEQSSPAEVKDVPKYAVNHVGPEAGTIFKPVNKEDNPKQ